MAECTSQMLMPIEFYLQSNIRTMHNLNILATIHLQFDHAFFAQSIEMGCTGEIVAISLRT